MAEVREWHYETDGQVFGPVSEQELIRQLAERILPSDTLVWTSGMQGWATASEINGLLDAAAIPPPVPAHRIANGWCLALALVPVWGLILEWTLLWGFAGGNDYRANEIYASGSYTRISWGLYAILNGFTSYRDTLVLEKQNVRLNYLMGALLVPVYLYQRGARLRQMHGSTFWESQTFFWVWWGALLLAVFAE